VNKLRLAVIGGGHLGTVHTKLAHELDEFAVIAVAEPNPAAQRAIAAQIPVATVNNHRELIGQIDAAVVATPSSLHHQVTIDLLEAGIHCLVEKPITVTVSEANDLVDLADRKGLVLQVGHVERFNPAFAAAMAHTVEPVFVEANRCFLHSLRSMDIGVVHDLMIHDIDLVLHMVGASLHRVEGVGGTIIGPKEDMAQAWLTFTNGVVANLKASRVSTDSCRSMTIYCRDRVIAIDFNLSQVVVTRHSERFNGEGLDVAGLNFESRRDLQQQMLHDDVTTQTIIVPKGNAIREELREFALCIRTGATPRVCGKAGRDALEIADLVCQRVHAFQRQHQLSSRPATLPQPRRRAG
jgi:predicted dehydrogenase